MTKRVSATAAVPLPSPSIEAARKLLHSRHMQELDAQNSAGRSRSRKTLPFPINLPTDAIAATAILGAALGSRSQLINKLFDGQQVVVILETIDEHWTNAIKESAKACFCIAPSKSKMEVTANEIDTKKVAYICSSGQKRPGFDASLRATIAIAEMRPVIGIASNPKHELPEDVLRTCDHYIVVTRFEADLLALVVEAVVGSPPLRLPPPEVLREARFQDIRLAFHRDRTADGCIERLESIVKPSAKFQNKGVRLEHLAGYGSIRDIGLAIAEDLRRYSKKELDWSEMERGLLIYGPPGTGKTLFARSLAAQAGLDLIAGSLALWQGTGEAHLGTTLKSMQATFTEARNRVPSILFIDELDSFGDRRSFPDRSSHYSTQVANGFLELLDGCVDREGVYLVGATNSPDRIDPAIMRSGRFDRRLALGLPSLDDVIAILRFHLGQDLLDSELSHIARRALGSTGADIANVVRQARGIARRSNRSLKSSDLLRVLEDLVEVVGQDLLKRSAIHEAGHAIAAHAYGFKIGDVAIQTPMPKANGFVTIEYPEILTAESCRIVLAVVLAGRAAEFVVLGTASASAANDLLTASSIARDMHVKWGLGRWLSVQPNPFVGRNVDDVVEADLQNAFAESCKLIEANRETLSILTEAILNQRALTGPELRTLLDR